MKELLVSSHPRQREALSDILRRVPERVLDLHECRKKTKCNEMQRHNMLIVLVSFKKYKVHNTAHFDIIQYNTTSNAFHRSRRFNNRDKRSLKHRQVVVQDASADPHSHGLKNFKECVRISSNTRPRDKDLPVCI